MKKLLVTLTALATGLIFLHSCNTKEIAPSRGESEYVEVTLTLDEAETKTINAQEKTLWAENDSLTAILTSYGEQDYYAGYLTYRGENKFTGRVTYPSDDNDWYLIYPYREDNVTPHKTHITVSPDLEQDGNGSMAHIAGPGFPLTGKAFDLTKGEPIEVQMKNVTARLDFPVTNTLDDPIVVKQVVFSTSKNISGDFVGDITNDNISWTAESGASKSVTLTVTDGARIAKDETAEFHVGVIPAIANGDDMKVKIVAVHPDAPETEIVYYKTYTSNKHLAPGKRYGFKDLNFDTTHSEDPLPGLEDPDVPVNPDKQNQELSFDEATVTLTLSTAGGTIAVQTVKGAQTDVTYSSSNSNVATVSGTTITIKGFGTTTITANAEEDETYNAAQASYTLKVEQSVSTTTTYTKATTLTVGGTYVIVDVADQRLFKGASDGSYVSVSPSNGVISDPTNSLAAYEFTITQSGSKYCLILKDGNKYLLCDYNSTSGNNTTGLTFESSKPSDSYLYSYTVNNGVFEFMTAQRNSTSTEEVLYYKPQEMGGTGPDKFKIGGSGKNIGVHLYLKTSEGSGTGKQNQNLSFGEPTVTKNMATASGTMSVQSVSGAYTNVTYSSSNTSVATVSGSTITIHGFGSTVITANAEASSTYNAASASYILNIQQSGSSDSSTRTYTYQSSVSAGTYLLGGFESDGSKYSIALFPDVLTGNWNSSQGSVTNGEYIGQRDIDSSTTLNYTNDSEIFDAEVDLIASSNNTWKIRINKTGKYLSVPSQDNKIVYVDSEASASAFTISAGTGSGMGMGMGGNSNTMGVSSGSYYFYHSGSAHGFSMRAYQVTNIRLYKKTSEGSGTGKQNQNLSFAQSTVSQSANVGSTFAVQTVQGAQTSVTYSSSNSNVATVSGQTITVTGFGSTTITATAAASTTYNSASASYTLTISQSGGGSSTGERTYTYTAPNSLQEGTYLIAGSESNELSVALFPTVITGSWNSQTSGQVNNGQYVPHKVYGSSNTANTITTTDSEIISGEVELVKNGNNWRFLVKANSQYLAAPSKEYEISFTGNASSAANFSINSGTNGATVQTGSYYFFHSGTAKGFTLRNNSTSNLRFYKLTSGGDNSGKLYQTLSFSNSIVNLSLESASGTYPVQAVSGNQTNSITYSSSNTNVATVSGTTITIKGFGSTEITANVDGNDNYYSASKSYTLNVTRAQQEGVFNLENDVYAQYLDEATSTYTSSNRNTSLIKYTGNHGGSVWGGGNNSGVFYSYSPSSSNRYDCPKPVTISWSSVLSGDKEVYVYTDAAHTQQVDYIIQPITASSASNSVEVSNLIPEKAGNPLTYYYVVKSGGSEVASGDFVTQGRRRMMKVSSTYAEGHANNCRDLGGQVTTSGLHIKYGKIFRGSRMNDTSSDEKQYLLNYMKIDLDVDLRGNNERQNSLSLSPDISNMADPNQYYTGHTNESYSSESELVSSDKRMGYTLRRIMNAAINNKNVYIHCAVGADRTGFTCMMIEAILGVPLERCDMDYETTSFSVVGGRQRGSTSYVRHYETGVSTVNGRLSDKSNATYQEKAIDYAVNGLGVPQSLITDFQNAMLE